MGADIRIYMEYLERKTNKYKCIGKFDGDRLYGVFGIIAGVRSDIKPIYPPRGLPIDVNDSMYKEYKGEPEYHTASWLSTSELRECLDAVYEIIRKEEEEAGRTYNPDWAKSYEQIYNYMKSSEEDGDPTRIVFWFDN